MTARRLSAPIDTPLGEMRVVSQSDGVLAVGFLGPNGAADLRLDAPAGPAPEAGDPHGVGARIAAWFSGERAAFDGLPLLPRGTAFQQRVWAALREIPWGETRTYGALARAVGRPSAARAVGAAVGRNPLAVIVPCHRVLGADGKLTGYAWGVARKRGLLRREGALPAAQQVTLFAPAR
jgi:methylated-DNA-[protein]-cysteine S-methyltransferase